MNYNYITINPFSSLLCSSKVLRTDSLGELNPRQRPHQRLSSSRIRRPCTTLSWRRAGIGSEGPWTCCTCRNSCFRCPQRLSLPSSSFGFASSPSPFASGGPWRRPSTMRHPSMKPLRLSTDPPFSALSRQPRLCSPVGLSPNPQQSSSAIDEGSPVSNRDVRALKA